MRSYFLVLVALLAVANASKIAGEYEALCGKVFDGPSAGLDIDSQVENNKIYASWSGFEDGKERNRVLHYEWSVVSEKQLKHFESCRSLPGFSGKPDTLGWQNVERKTSVSANVNLERGITYYVVLRTTNSFGRQTFVNSNGIMISEEQVETPNYSILSEVKSIHEMNKRDVVFPGVSPVASNGLVFDFQITCPIDAANRCAQSKISVGDYLTEIYGPPEFANPAAKPGTIAIAGGSSDVIFKVVPEPEDPNKKQKSPGNVDNNPLNTGAAIGLAIGVVALFFVLFAVLVVVAGLFSRAKDGKLGTGGSNSDEIDEH